MYQPLTVTALYDLHHTIATPLLARVTYPWEALTGLEEFIDTLVRALPHEQYRSPAPGVWVHVTAQVASTASLGRGCIIGEGAQVRHGAFIRGNALIGKGAVVGNSTEIKNAILFDEVQVPHYNYVGDSILGYRAHLGAGAVTSNVKSDRSLVTVRFGKSAVETGRKKLGAMLGDRVEVGCNAVLNPGTIIGQDSRVYPLTSVRGYVPTHSIVKQNGGIFPQHV